MSESTVRVELDGTIAWVTLDRPPKNLLDAGLTSALATTLVDLDGREDVTTIAITGRGEYFCGGADGPSIRETGTAAEFAEAAVRLFTQLNRSRTPIIAAVNGDALAGGFGLVCSSDIVLAVGSSRLGTIEASIGTWPMIAQVAAVRRVPQKAALTNALTGIPFTAQEALGHGIVDEIVAVGDLRARVRDYSALIAKAGTAASIGRPALLRAYDQPFDQAIRDGADAFVAMFTR